MIAVVIWRFHNKEPRHWVIDTDRILPANAFERDVYNSIVVGGYTVLDGNAYNGAWGQFVGLWPRCCVDLPQVVSKISTIKVVFE